MFQPERAYGIKACECGHPVMTVCAW